MSHFTEGVLQSYLDEEVAAGARAQVSAHVGDCAECADRLQELRALGACFASAMAGLDLVVAPTVSITDLRVRTQQRNWHERLRYSRRALARAALFVVGLSGAAAAAVPGSPVRDWLAGAWNAIAGEQAPVTPTVATPHSPTYTALGNRIAPANGHVRIMLEGFAGATVHVILVEEDKAMVEGSGEVLNARTRSGPGPVLVVSGEGRGDLRISLPQTVQAAIVEINNKVYVTKEGDTLLFHGPAADTIGSELVFKPNR